MVILGGASFTSNNKILQVKEAGHNTSPVVRFHLYEISRMDKSMETESTLMLARDWGDRRMGNDCLMGRSLLCG